MAKQKVQHYQRKMLIILFGVIEGNTGPSGLGEYLNQICLSGDEGSEIGELVIATIGLTSRQSGGIIEDFHSENTEDIVDDHEKR